MVYQNQETGLDQGDPRTVGLESSQALSVSVSEIEESMSPVGRLTAKEGSGVVKVVEQLAQSSQEISTERALHNINGSLINGQIMVDIPALLACRSFLACIISSSVLRLRSASWPSFFSLRLAILARNWSTDSAPSLLALMSDFVVLFLIGGEGCVDRSEAHGLL